MGSPRGPEPELEPLKRLLIGRTEGNPFFVEESVRALVESGALDLATLIERLTAGPVRALGLERSVLGLGSLAEGAPADVVLLDPAAEWTVEPERFASKGKNTPLAGRTLRGKVVATVYGGRVVWAEERVRA